MNVLVYDAPASVAHLVRALLRSLGHRVSLAADADDAALKLRTALFDAVVFGPAGAPETLARFLEQEMPGVPVVLAGVPVAVPAAGQVAAVLPAPLSPLKLADTFRRLERLRQERVRKLPVELEAGEGLTIACRLAELSPETLVLAGESDEFHRHFEGAPRHVRARVAGRLLAGDVRTVETDPARRLRRVAVQVDPGGMREVLSELLR
jgi:CheY-like chemotaxis protein